MCALQQLRACDYSISGHAALNQALRHLALSPARPFACLTRSFQRDRDTRLRSRKNLDWDRIQINAGWRIRWNLDVDLHDTGNHSRCRSCELDIPQHAGDSQRATEIDLDRKVQCRCGNRCDFPINHVADLNAPKPVANSEMIEPRAAGFCGELTVPS